MNRSEFESVAKKIMEESVTEFVMQSAMVQEELDDIKEHFLSGDIVTRMANLAESYVVSAEPEGRLRAHVEKVSFPSGKDIQIQLSVPSDVPRRLVAAELSGRNVVIFDDDTTLAVSTEVQVGDGQADLEEYIAENEEGEQE